MIPLSVLSLDGCGKKPYTAPLVYEVKVFNKIKICG